MGISVQARLNLVRMNQQIISAALRELWALYLEDTSKIRPEVREALNRIEQSLETVYGWEGDLANRAGQEKPE